MNDVLEPLIRLIPALITLLAVIAGWSTGPGKLRAEFKIDAEILQTLPDGIAKEHFQAYFAGRIEQLQRADNGTRDWPLFVFAVVATLLLAYAAIWLWGLGHWWTYGFSAVAGSLFLVCLYGVFESAQKTDRTKPEIGG